MPFGHPIISDTEFSLIFSINILQDFTEYCNKPFLSV